MGILTLLLLMTIVQSGCSEFSNQPAAAPSEGSAVITQTDTPSRIESITFKSAALDRDMAVDIYLPPGYSPENKYPVLYILYGYGGDQSSWFTFLGLNQEADRLIEEQRIKPLIIVSPDYKQSFGVNSKAGEGINPGGVDEGSFGDYLSEDVVSYVDTHYSTISTRDGRYIGGASMGGYAALYHSFTNPELFSKVGGHSSALWDYSKDDMYIGQRDWLYPSQELRSLRDPFLLAENKGLDSVQVYLDVGDSDELSEVNKRFYKVLQANQVQVEWHLTPGGHNVDYWKRNLESYLMFYAGM